MGKSSRDYKKKRKKRFYKAMNNNEKFINPSKIAGLP